MITKHEIIVGGPPCEAPGGRMPNERALKRMRAFAAAARDAGELLEKSPPGAGAAAGDARPRKLIQIGPLDV